MKATNKYVIGGIILAVFLIFTILVMTVDVKAIGPEGTEVGFAALNGAVAKSLGYKDVWYKISKVLGIITFLPVFCFAALGVYQLIKRRSILKVDRDILILGGFYIVVLLCFAAFELLKINYRPVILDDGLEASYPSTHTMLALCIMVTAILQISRRVAQPVVKNVLMAACALIAVLLVITRMLSGVHWFTDIIGGLLISATLIWFYYALTMGNEE